MYVWKQNRSEKDRSKHRIFPTLLRFDEEPDPEDAAYECEQLRYKADIESGFDCESIITLLAIRGNIKNRNNADQPSCRGCLCRHEFVGKPHNKARCDKSKEEYEQFEYCQIIKKK